MRVLIASFILFTSLAVAQESVIVNVDFNTPLRDWDGFGVNYVQTRHARDFAEFDQDYGGFKYLNDQQRAEIIDLVFGEDGLKPGIIKMFCDPFHEPENDNDDPYTLDMSKFDHQTTTTWMRYFAREGFDRTQARGDTLQILAGLYGPPAWTTKQKCIRGRDMDQAMKKEVAEYIASWAKYLREEEGLPVTYISMHNEGENQNRWDGDGVDRPSLYQHDYNMWWPWYQIVDFLRYARPILDANGLRDVGLSCGETATWANLVHIVNWDSVQVNIAQEIVNEFTAVANLGLITSHGFNQKYTPEGVDILRGVKPDLHAWTTSYTWGDMNVDILKDARHLIYDVKCNALIPWATVHNDFESDRLQPPHGFRVSSNANSPIKTNDGKVEITKAFYFFKQISRAGQPGMAVAAVESNDADIQVMAWDGKDSKHADAFVLLNTGTEARTVDILVQNGTYRMVRTSDVDFGNEDYVEIDPARQTSQGQITYVAPPRSATTFTLTP